MTTPPPPPPPPTSGPPGYASNDEKNWALVAHFGGAAGMLFLGAAGGWIAPLIALLVRGNQSPTVRAHSINALNFQLTWSIVGVIGYLTICVLVGVVLVPVAALVGIVFGIIGGIKANDGELYEYPATIKMVK